MERFTCRTCLSVVDIDNSFQISDRCFYQRSIKDVLLQYIPQMENSITGKDRICKICLSTVKTFVKFVEKCIEIDNSLKNQRVVLENIEFEEASDEEDLKDVDNIQIILEKDMKPYFTKDGDSSSGSSVTMPSPETVTHDHSYMKHSVNPDEIKNEVEYVQEDDDLTDQETDFGEIESIKLIPVATVSDEMLGEGFMEVCDSQEDSSSRTNLTVLATGDEFVDPEMVTVKEEPLKHLEADRFKCDICGQQFARADYLRNHIKRHEEDKNKDNVKCRVPGKFLRFKNTDDPLPCKICGKYYNGIQKLKVHLQTHLVVKRFACEYCDLTYKRWPSLKRHEKTHLEAGSAFHRCNVCWKRFYTKEELDFHMTQHGNPRYRCQVCDEQFHRKYLFDNHYLLKHATPEDIENSKKEVIYDTLLELSNQNLLISE